MRARRGWGIGLAGAVLLLHLWTLGLWWPDTPKARPTATPAVTVWTVRPALASPGASVVARVDVVAVRPPGPTSVRTPGNPLHASEAVEVPAPAAPGLAQELAGPAGVELPLYAATPPPSLHLRYTAQRGERTGVADLRWSVDADGAYVLSVSGQIEGAPVFEWLSRGRVDVTGLAPERYVARRRGRGAQAANFDREGGKITYSGPRVERALPLAAQDRASWLLQLAAVVEAEPQRFVRGQPLHLYVTGARADADVWTFDVRGAQAVRLGEETVMALHLVRAAPRTYETRAEVWLDPARQHLPVRIRLGVEGSALAPLDLRMLAPVR